MLSSPSEEQEFREANIHTASPIAEEDMTRCVTLPSRMERENQYLLVITASVEQLNLGPGGNNARKSTPDENAFWNP